MDNCKLPSKKPIYNSHPGRVSAFASLRGSITVEAAAVVPIFFFAVLCLFYLMEIMAVRTAVRSGLQYAGKIISEEAYGQMFLTPSKVETYVVEAIGADRLERSIVEGGSSGIDCSSSSMSMGTGIAQLRAVYKIRIPVPMFLIPPVTYTEDMRIKTWTGYEKTGVGDENSETVYITETGIVYHRDYHCTYLELSIQGVSESEVDGLRNENGGKYHACERCQSGGDGLVYITDHGDRYHNSLSCSGLKRTIYSVPVSEAAGKGACSKCGQ